MTRNIYIKNLKNLELFFNYFCEHKHPSIEKKVLLIKDDAQLNLCPECEELFNYAHHKLSNCELDPKPKCRECEDKCYSNVDWKKMATVMKYSGMRLGLVKLKNKILFK